MASLDDKKAFSERLTYALKRSGSDATSATQLAMQFNLRHRNEPITAQAAQKWLTGKARPTVDKIETLAQWLNVSVEWLRFGVAETRQYEQSQNEDADHANHKLSQQVAVTRAEQEILEGLRKLTPHQQQLVISLVNELATERQLGRR